MGPFQMLKRNFVAIGQELQAQWALKSGQFLYPIPLLQDGIAQAGEAPDHVFWNQWKAETSEIDIDQA